MPYTSTVTVKDVTSATRWRPSIQVEKSHGVVRSVGAARELDDELFRRPRFRATESFFPVRVFERGHVFIIRRSSLSFATLAFSLGGLYIYIYII